MLAKFRNRYRIESTRLRGYDYSRNGAYFITICTKNRICLFGEIVIDVMDFMIVETGLRPVSTITPNTPITPNCILAKIKLSDAGEIVYDCWYDLPNHYSNIILDEFIVMPNHIHGIIIIENNIETGLRPVSIEKQKYGLSEFVRAFKSFSSRRINEIRKPNKYEIWQPRFYDHIIHSDNELDRIRNYIKNNPKNWINDRNNNI
jgi:REP element-mobilizing transposase RayT